VRGRWGDEERGTGGQGEMPGFDAFSTAQVKLFQIMNLKLQILMHPPQQIMTDD
jgi:hypothetical protein